jgi:hypothetical protein
VANFAFLLDNDGKSEESAHEDNNNNKDDNVDESTEVATDEEDSQDLTNLSWTTTAITKRRKRLHQSATSEVEQTQTPEPSQEPASPIEEQQSTPSAVSTSTTVDSEPLKPTVETTEQPLAVVDEGLETEATVGDEHLEEIIIETTDDDDLELIIEYNDEDQDQVMEIEKTTQDTDEATTTSEPQAHEDTLVETCDTTPAPVITTYEQPSVTTDDEEDIEIIMDPEEDQVHEEPTTMDVTSEPTTSESNSDNLQTAPANTFAQMTSEERQKSILLEFESVYQSNTQEYEIEEEFQCNGENDDLEIVIEEDDTESILGNTTDCPDHDETEVTNASNDGCIEDDTTDGPDGHGDPFTLCTCGCAPTYEAFPIVTLAN